MELEHRMSELEAIALQLRAMQNRRRAEQRAARFRPDGKLAPKLANNRSIAEAAVARLPGVSGAAVAWATRKDAALS